MENSNKNINKKTSNISNATHKNRQTLFHTILGEHTLFLSPLPFLQGENENWVNWENWDREGADFLKSEQDKRRGERNAERRFIFSLT